MSELEKLLESIPQELRDQSLTHASWSQRKVDSYERLAFLGDSVLGLAISTQIHNELTTEQYGAGRLTEIRATTVCGAACARIAAQMGVPQKMIDLAPAGHKKSAANLVQTERVLASVCEAIIGACYLEFGYERVAAAVLADFGHELEKAKGTPADDKNRLQELLATQGKIVSYEVVEELGLPHDREFRVVATVDGEVVGSGSGKSKKAAEREAATEALKSLSKGLCTLKPSTSRALSHFQIAQSLFWTRVFRWLLVRTGRAKVT